MTKKRFSLILTVLLAGATIVSANWLFRASYSRDFTASTVLTNTVPTPFRISSLSCDWTASVTATTSVYRTRSYVSQLNGTNSVRKTLLRAFPVAAASTLFVTGDELESFYFIKGDVLTIEDNSGAGVTNFAIIDLEDIH